jgi:DNA primase
MIPPKTVQEILDAVRIEDVVGEFVTLRRRGVNMIGLCPFHGERTPSFNVNPVRNIFKCFGCGKAGDAITFLKEHENFTYPDALRWLARKYSIDIPEVVRTPEEIMAQQHEASLHIVNDFALKHFQEQLFETDEGKSVALSYFKKRGLTEATMQAFGLGYAPDARDLLLRRAKVDNYSPDLLRQLGLCSQDATRDFFRARVMFAIHGMSGKVIAFAGRTMSTDKTIPKYINSPETSIYVKNKILYGFYQAKKAVRQHDNCILVEGYMDVISLYQAGIEHVVASSGTSLTEGQLQLIKRNTNNLTILYDGDPAGIKAALRGIDLALEQDLDVKMVLLPEGEDPDSYVQKVGTDAFRAYLVDNAKDFILFKTDLLLAETKGDPIKRATLIKDIVGSIARIPDPIKRNVYLQACAAQLQVSEEALMSEINKLLGQAIKKQAEKSARQPEAASDSMFPNMPPPDMPEVEGFTDSNQQSAQKQVSIRGDEFQERDIVRLLVQFGTQMLPEGHTVAEHVLSALEDSIDSFDNALYGKIVNECHQQHLAGQPIDKDFFLQHTDSQVSALAYELLTSPWEMSVNWEQMWNYPLQNQVMPDLNFNLDMTRALDEFTKRKLHKMCLVVQTRLGEAEKTGDHEQAEYQLRVYLKLKESLREVMQRTGTVILPKAK